MEENITMPDYSSELKQIIEELKSQKNYLNDKTLYFRECVLRLYSNTEFDNNKKNQKLIMEDCIKRAKILANKIFD